LVYNPWDEIAELPAKKLTTHNLQDFFIPIWRFVVVDDMLGTEFRGYLKLLV